MFQRPQHPHLIVGVDGCGGFRVHSLQRGIHGSWAFCSQLGRQLFPQALRRFFRRKLHAIQKALDIQPRTAHQNGQMAPGGDLRFQPPRQRGEIRHAEHGLRRQDVHPVVGHAAGLFRRHFGGTDVEAPIDLHGVGADDLPRKALCQRDAQRRFARGGGADDGQHGMLVFTRCGQTASPAPFGSISTHRGGHGGRRAAPRRKGSSRPAPSAPAGRSYPLP